MKYLHSPIKLILVFCLLLSISQASSAATKPFGVKPPELQSILNDYWVIYGLAEGEVGRNGATPAINDQTNALEWMAIKAAWLDHPMRNQLIDMLKSVPVNGVNAKGKEPNGFVWADKDNEAWRGMYSHYDQIPRYICAAAELWNWTRNKDFLTSILPSVEAAMDYMLTTMNGAKGIVSCPGDANGLSNVGKPTTFMDCYREGHDVTWINEGFYSALLAMRDMEQAAGHPDKSAYYQKLAKSCLAQFDKVFWSVQSKRYVGWKDSAGKVHDYGFTYVNLEALARGLGDADKAYMVFDWLDNGKAQATVKGGHKGSRDIYQLVAAPRTNTVRIADADWDSWSLRERPILGDFYKYGYGAITRDGGTMLWYGYYDVMARLRWLDADSAWNRLSATLKRCQGDPKFLTFGPQGTNQFRAFDMYEEHFLEIGSADTYQSSGILPVSVLHGFMGVRPTDSGLRVSPKLPSSLSQLSCKGIAYGKTSCDIEVKRTNRIKMVIMRVGVQKPDGLTFASAQPFSALDIETTGTGAVKLTLKRKMGSFWKTIASRDISAGIAVQFVFADQPAGNYKLEMSPSKSDIHIDSLIGYRNVYEVISPQLGFIQYVEAGNSVIIKIGD